MGPEDVIIIVLTSGIVSAVTSLILMGRPKDPVAENTYLTAREILEHIRAQIDRDRFVQKQLEDIRSQLRVD